MQSTLAEKHIPLYTTSHSLRATLPDYVLSLMKKWKATRLFANMEYEVDELRRDLKLSELAKKDGGITCTFVHDRCIIAPGEVLTKDGRGYTVLIARQYIQSKPKLTHRRMYYQVYSPFLRAWMPHLTPKGKDSPIACAPAVAANSASVREHKLYGSLFDSTVPEKVEGFTMDDPEERERIRICWPAGEDAAKQVRSALEHLQLTQQLTPEMT